jgi:hypothetical protein
MSKYISQYTETTTPADTDFFLLQRGLTYYKVQKSNLASASDLESVLLIGNNSGVSDIIMKGNQGIQFMNPLDTFYTKILAGAQGSNLTLTLPTTAGSSGQFMQTNGAGTLTWASALTGSLTSGRVPYASGASTLTDTSLFVFDGTKLGVGLTTPTATIHLAGATADSTAFALKVDNSGGSGLWYVRNDGGITSTTTSNNRTVSFYANSITHFSTGNNPSNDYGVAIGTEWGTSGNTGLLYMIKSTAASVTLQTTATNSYSQYIQYAGTTRLNTEVYGNTYAGVLQGTSVISSISGGKVWVASRGGDIWLGDTDAGSTPKMYVMYSTGNVGIGVSPDTTARLHVKGSDSTSSNYALKVDNSSSTALMYFRNDGNWSNSFTTLTDRWSDMRHSGTADNGYVRSFSRTNAGGLDGYNIYTSVQSGSNTTAVRLSPGGTGTGVSEGLVSVGGTGNQSWGVRGQGGDALVSVGVQGTVTTGGSTYAAAVLGSASGSAGTSGVSYAIWGNHTGTAAVSKYGGYFDSSGANGTNIGGYFRAVSAGTNYALVTAGGNIGFGTVTPSAQALVEMASTTQALLIMRMTSTQASAITPANGMMLYSTDTNGTFTSVGFWGYENGAWVKL